MAISESKKKRSRPRPRKRIWTPADRAAHRVFERSRREAFNDSMVVLARQIPSLSKTRRLNKHMIVQHSIARHKSQRELCLAAAGKFRNLLRERDELLAEVNFWRLSSSIPVIPIQAKPPGPIVPRFLDLEHESFGEFQNGFGDNAGEDHLHDQLNEDYGEEETCVHPLETPFTEPPLQTASMQVDLLPLGQVGFVGKPTLLAVPECPGQDPTQYYTGVNEPKDMSFNGSIIPFMDLHEPFQGPFVTDSPNASKDVSQVIPAAATVDFGVSGANVVQQYNNRHSLIAINESSHEYMLGAWE